MDDLDRFHLGVDVIDRVPKLGARAACTKRAVRDRPMGHEACTYRPAEDMPEIVGRTWGQAAASGGVRSTEADNV
jgi:xylulose-5-phosphate/fructose-6-phosphate phosphoketolase